MERISVSNLVIHEQCNLVPRMQSVEWQEFCSDVQQRGVQEPIVVQRGGVVLDGRHRLEATKETGGQLIPARMVDLNEKDQLELIITSAVLRRHLTDDQRSILAVRFREPLSRAAKADRSRKAGKTGGSGRPKAKNSLLADVSNKLNPVRDTRKDASQTFQVSERKVRSATEIVRDDPQLAERVLKGELTLPQAKQELRREQKRVELKAKAKRAQESTATAPSWEIRQGNCIDILPTLTDKARLVFADPPYNIGIDYGNGKTADLLPSAEYMRWVERWLTSCRDLLTDDGSMWILISDEFAAEYAVSLKQLGLTIRSWIIWYESFGVNCSRGFNRCSRHLFYCVRNPQNFVFNEEAVTRPSDRQVKYGDKRAATSGKLWDSVWGIEPAIPRLTGTSHERVPDFPTQLPLKLLTPIVLCASDPGDLVLDPFNGSGTTGVAAIRNSRRYVGIEQSPQFANLATLRLKGVGHD